jgi:ATP-dependent Clp protease ATP-binding subunit ClpA
LLLDEIEKAHSDVTNVLLQFMDNGFITGSNGKVADGRNCILIMTSNLGARDNESNTIGFGDLGKEGEDDKAVKKFFAPEFRNRLDAIIKFTSLGHKTVCLIVEKFISELNSQLKDKNIEIVANKEAVNWMAIKGYDKKMGARPLARLIDNKIKSPMSRRVLFGDLKDGGVVTVNIVNDDLDFTVTEYVKPLTKAERKALKAAAQVENVSQTDNQEVLQ